MTEAKLQVVYKDGSIVAINKPHDLMVHRSPIAAENADVFALQLLRDQLHKKVYPVHRLDRKTGGVLLFALEHELHKTLQSMFAEGQISKEYLTIVRGFTDDAGTIDYALKNETGKKQEAVSKYETIARTELQVPFGKHNTSRYSLVRVRPLTGRMHQIRKHMAHILHPIIADRPHGCNKQNKLFKEKWDMTTMMLHASSLSFVHPVSNDKIRIAAPVQHEFRRMMNMMGWGAEVNSAETLGIE